MGCRCCPNVMRIVVQAMIGSWHFDSGTPYEMGQQPPKEILTRAKNNNNNNNTKKKYK